MWESNICEVRFFFIDPRGKVDQGVEEERGKKRKERKTEKRKHWLNFSYKSQIYRVIWWRLATSKKFVNCLIVEASLFTGFQLLKKECRLLSIHSETKLKR